MRTVILVPWRGGDPIRERNWEITRRHLVEDFRIPIYTGDRDGPWSRAAAVNAAARDAGDWDVAMIADADTIQEITPAKQAWLHVRHHGGAVVPWSRRWLLNENATLRIGEGGNEPFLYPRKWAKPDGGAGSTLVIARQAWDVVHGMDERFVGWGLEDRAFTTALSTFSTVTKTKGTVWHLHHVPDPVSVEHRFTHGGTPEMRKHFDRYREARGDREAMRALIEEGVG
jgi:N-terminal domain of galactosyltransferase